MKISTLPVVMLVLVAYTANSQTPQFDAQSFEVAMLRLEDPHNTVDYNRPDAPNQTRVFPTNRLLMYHTYLKSVIAIAYGVDYGKILGGPDWLNSQHYDLSAKVSGNALLTREEMRPMLRSLLRERVRLAVHTERRIVSGYELVIAKGGSKLRANTGAPYGGRSMGFDMSFQNVSPETLTKMIESAVKQPVVDKTGVTGMYDFELKFTPDNTPADSPYAGFGSVFTAVEEQLGLKLVAAKVPIDYLIIDNLDRTPAEN